MGNIYLGYSKNPRGDRHKSKTNPKTKQYGKHEGWREHKHQEMHDETVDKGTTWTHARVGQCVNHRGGETPEQNTRRNRPFKMKQIQENREQKGTQGHLTVEKSRKRLKNSS